MLTSRIGHRDRFVEARKLDNDEFHIKFYAHKSLLDETKFTLLATHEPGSTVNGAAACYRSQDYMITSLRATRESSANLLRALEEIL